MRNTFCRQTTAYDKLFLVPSHQFVVIAFFSLSSKRKKARKQSHLNAMHNVDNNKNYVRHNFVIALLWSVIFQIISHWIHLTWVTLLVLFLIIAYRLILIMESIWYVVVACIGWFRLFSSIHVLLLDDERFSLSFIR